MIANPSFHCWRYAKNAATCASHPTRPRRLNILHPQCFNWNAKPLRGGVAFRKQRNMQWRMVSQHGVQSCVVGGVGTRDVETCLDRRMRRKGEAAVQRDVKDEVEVEIDRVERR